MNLIFDHGQIIKINLYHTPIATIAMRWIKHLGNIKIPWRPWEYRMWVSKNTWQEISRRLQQQGEILDINVDINALRHQAYLNDLHRIYEKGYDGTQNWTDFHEMIHMMEQKRDLDQGKAIPIDILELNYRHLGGALARPFEKSLMAHGTTTVRKGQVFLAWDELGKPPWFYWYNNEPDDIDRFCELSKPWIQIRPKINLALEDHDFLPPDTQQFAKWYDARSKDWCQHWGIDSWTLRDQFTVLPFGEILESDTCRDILGSGGHPSRLTLDSAQDHV